jgi:hypothetical protein
MFQRNVVPPSSELKSKPSKQPTSKKQVVSKVLLVASVLDPEDGDKCW